MTAVVDGPAGLTPPWLTGVLRGAGCDATVLSIDAERIGTGQMGATYRLALDSDQGRGPSTLVLKVACDDEAKRAAVATGYAAEVGFYEHLAPDLDVWAPNCWYAAITSDRTRFTLLLDDAAPAVPGVQAEGCSLDQARAAVDNLVGLHAPRWGDADLFGLRFLLRPSEKMAATMQAAASGATDEFIDRYREVLEGADVDTLRSVASRVGQWQLAGLEHSTLVHGDYRLDNLLFTPGSDEVVAVDWQSAGVGPAPRDVAYFLGTSLETELRRTHERELVEGYHAALVDRGVEDYDSAQCWDAYRLGHLQGPITAVIGCIYASGERSEGSDEMFLAMVRRSCAAIRDHDTLALL